MLPPTPVNICLVIRISKLVENKLATEQELFMFCLSPLWRLDYVHFQLSDHTVTPRGIEYDIQDPLVILSPYW